MTLVLETGTGIRNANSYVLPSYVTAYLTDLNRQTENSWSSLSTAQQEAACIAATAYIDQRWGRQFKGTKEVVFQGINARAILTTSGQPSNNDTLTVGQTSFTFVDTLDDFNPDEIEIGDDVDATIVNIITAINNDKEVTAALRTGTTDQILLQSPLPGESFNNTALNADSATNTAVTEAFQYGEDAGPQPLQFPRSGLVADQGRTIYGIPRNLLQAASEYAVRSAASSLVTDPVTDSTGRVVVEKTEKVDVIQTTVKYAEGAVLEQMFKPYPGADSLLKPFIKSGGTFR